MLKALRALAKDMEQQQAPPQLEATLRLAFRAQHRRPRRWFLMAAAALILLNFGLVWRFSKLPEVARIEPPKLAVPAPVLTAATKPKPRPKRRVARPVEVATGFIPVSSSPATTSDPGRIVRVRVPRSTLSGFGFPVNPDRMLESVKADVVLGDGGMIRAIRFVQ